MIDARENYDSKLAPGLIRKAVDACKTKTELAARLGMTPQYINAILRGEKTMSYGMQVMLECIIDDVVNYDQAHNRA